MCWLTSFLPVDAFAAFVYLIILYLVLFAVHEAFLGQAFENAPRVNVCWDGNRYGSRCVPFRGKIPV